MIGKLTIGEFVLVVGALLLSFPAGAIARQIWDHRHCHRVCGWWRIGHSLYCTRFEP